MVSVLRAGKSLRLSETGVFSTKSMLDDDADAKIREEKKN